MSGLPTNPRDVRLTPPRQPATGLPRAPGAAVPPLVLHARPRERRRSSSRERRPSVESSRSGSGSGSGSGSPTVGGSSSHQQYYPYYQRSRSGSLEGKQRSRSPSLSGEDISNPKKLHVPGTPPPSAFRPVGLPPLPPPKSASAPAPHPAHQPRPALHPQPSAVSLRTTSSHGTGSSSSRRPRLSLWPSSPYVPSPYAFRAGFEGLTCLWAFVLLILGGTVLGGRVDEGAHPAVTVLVFASALVLAWYPLTLTLARVRPSFLLWPLDRVWLHCVVEVMLWLFFLGGSAAIGSPFLTATVRLSCALGFICFTLLTFDLALTALRVAGIRRGGTSSPRASPVPSSRQDVEKQQQQSPPRAPSVDTSLPILRFLLVIPVTAGNLFPSYASLYPSGPVRTWVPPSSTAWPSSLPPDAQAEMEKQQFRQSPNPVFLGSEPAPGPPNAGSDPARSAVHRQYSGQYWVARHAEQGYLETLASEELRRMGDAGHLQDQRNAGLVSQYSQYSQHSLPAYELPPRPPAALSNRRGSSTSVESRMSSYFRDALKGTPPGSPSLTSSSSPETSASDLNTSFTALNTGATTASVRGAEVRHAQRQQVPNSRRL